MNPTNEELSLYLCEIIPDEQLDRVFAACGTNANIHGEFMGFVDTYWHLSRILPKDIDIYDFGCAYNAQSFFFKDFKSYHAIEPLDGTIIEELFCAPNCTIYRCTAGEFLKSHFIRKGAFAIVNYVPDWHGEKVIDLIHENFQNCYTFYPIAL